MAERSDMMLKSIPVPAKTKRVDEFVSGDMLVGRAGGLSQIINVTTPDAKGIIEVVTEHGVLSLYRGCHLWILNT